MRLHDLSRLDTPVRDTAVVDRWQPWNGVLVMAPDRASGVLIPWHRVRLVYYQRSR